MSVSGLRAGVKSLCWRLGGNGLLVCLLYPIDGGEARLYPWHCVLSGEEATDKYRISSAEELRLYVDRQKDHHHQHDHHHHPQSDDEGFCWRESPAPAPRSLKLL